MNPVKSTSNNIEPAVHLEFIQNQLEAAESSNPEQVEQYHRALFLHHHGPDWEKYQQQIRVHEGKVAFLEGRLREIQLRLSERTKWVPVTVDGREDVHPTSPWNAWDVGMVVACSLGILSLIIFGILNISFNLLESGLITFRENPIRCYFWAALLPVGALAVKIGWDFLEEPRQRNRYLWVCLTMGVCGVLVWVAAYACVYPTLSKGISEQIASLSVFDQTSPGSSVGSGLNFAGAKWIDAITVAGQALAEIFLSAVLGMYLTNLYAAHRPVRLAHDPAFAHLEKERQSLESEIADERLQLGEATGQLRRLENQLSALIAFGGSIYRREAARRQDQSEKKQIVLDQLSDHLRHHLQAIDSDRRMARSAAEPSFNTNNGSSAV
jgi:hypothetical protein